VCVRESIKGALASLAARNYEDKLEEKREPKQYFSSLFPRFFFFFSPLHHLPSSHPSPEISPLPLPLRQWPPPDQLPPASSSASIPSSCASPVCPLTAPPVIPPSLREKDLYFLVLLPPAWIDWSVILVCCFCRAVELKKQISCSMQLSNLSDDYIAFKVRLSSLGWFFGPYGIILETRTGTVLRAPSCVVRFDVVYHESICYSSKFWFRDTRIWVDSDWKMWSRCSMSPCLITECLCACWNLKFYLCSHVLSSLDKFWTVSLCAAVSPYGLMYNSLLLDCLNSITYGIHLGGDFAVGIWYYTN
jgi:hypothetical protein